MVVSFAHTRPIQPFPLAIHFARQASRIALRPLRPVLKAPSDLEAIAARHPLPERDDMHTHWGGGKPQKQALLEAVEDAGFEDVRPSWCGNEVTFDSPEEFWEAQAAIVTNLRKRLELAEPGVRDGLRDDFINRATDTLERGGRLIYPFGSYAVVGRHPQAH
jgi:hypothetical protein